MGLKPPSNLPPDAQPWGRWASDQIALLQQQVSNLTQATGNNGKANTSSIDLLSNKIVGIQSSVVGLIANATFDATQVVSGVFSAARIPSLSASLISGSMNLAGGSIASGAISANGDVVSNGRVYSAGIVQSPGTKSNVVTTGYSGMWIDVNGNMGGSTSSRRFKQDITAVTTNDSGMLGLQIYKFRYIDAVTEHGDAAQWECGFMAEDVVTVAPWACFFEADGTTVRGVNYDRLVVSLLDVAQSQIKQIDALASRLTVAGL
jgi:hypothetical protein